MRVIVSVEDDLKQRLAERPWEPIAIERGDRRLEFRPVHGKLGAGFSLRVRGPDGNWTVLATGHTANGQVVDSSGDPITLPREIGDQIERLLTAEDG